MWLLLVFKERQLFAHAVHQSDAEAMEDLVRFAREQGFEGEKPKEVMFQFWKAGFMYHLLPSNAKL